MALAYACALCVVVGSSVGSLAVNAGALENPRGANDPNQPHGADDFDASDKTWWESRVGALGMDGERQELLLDENLVIQSNGYEITNAVIDKGENAPVSELTDTVYVYIDDARDVLLQNSILSVPVYSVTTNRTQGNVIMDHCTFVQDTIIGRCFEGLAIHATYNYLSSHEDGITPIGGDSMDSYIAYNWFDGPGRDIRDLHSDGIQIWREGNTVIYRNRIGGYSNACIFIKSGVAPRYGSGPIENVVIQENYFENNGLNWYYIYIRDSENPTAYHLTRPQYITITDNWFEDPGKYPISSGSAATEQAMFVRTQEERDEGVRRQQANPDVLRYRAELGYHETSADARTWIVWDNNRWVTDGSEVVPTYAHTSEALKGWYDLSGERERYGGADDEDGAISVRFDKSSKNSNHPAWYIHNNTDETIPVTLSFSNGEEEAIGAEPGDNRVSTDVVQGDNVLTVGWMEAGEPKTLEVFGFHYNLYDLEVRYAETGQYNVLWDITNPSQNKYTIRATWTVEGSAVGGNVWISPGDTIHLSTVQQPGETVLHLTWRDGYGNERSATAHSAPSPATHTITLSEHWTDDDTDTVTVHQVEEGETFVTAFSTPDGYTAEVEADGAHVAVLGNAVTIHAVSGDVANAVTYIPRESPVTAAGVEMDASAGTAM